MGVDWIPCRVEAGVVREEIDRLVEAERWHFSQGGFFSDSLESLAVLPEPERAAVEADYQRLGPVKDRLLFKMASHRVSVVTGNQVFPLEWRLRAFGTILPWDLPGQVEQWTRYRDEVQKGGHRAYLFGLMVYLESLSLAEAFRDTLVPLAERARECRDSWATRPELMAIRDQILASPCPPVTPPPRWPDEAGRPLTQPIQDDGRLQDLKRNHRQVVELAQDWNAVVQRGNRRCQLPAPLLDLEEWIAKWQPGDWFASFLVWLRPWLGGGYGLYRDCE